MKVRLDKLLLQRGLVASRERAQALILAGRVLVDEQKIEKAGATVEQDVAIRLLGDEMPYVSRAGVKLEYALRHWKISLADAVCVDIGASTGGFTDCMLQHGAARVIAIDTGYGQMDARIRSDVRVAPIERKNARYLSAADLADTSGGPIGIDFMAMDVSFISATLLLPAVVRAIQLNNEIAESAKPLEAVILVKPQFEVGRELVGKGGIVRSAEAQEAAVNKVCDAVRSLRGEAIEVVDSPILGAKGNKEFLLHCSFVGGVN